MLQRLRSVTIGRASTELCSCQTSNSCSVQRARVCSQMPLDIALFRDDARLAAVRESQRRRAQPDADVDAVVALDKAVRAGAQRHHTMHIALAIAPHSPWR